MKNYLVITPFFPSETNFRGGYVYDQVQSIKKNSHYNIKVIILSSLYSKKQQNYIYNGIECFPFRVWDFPSFFLPSFFQRINNFRLLRFLKKHNIELKQTDVVHSHVCYPAAYFSSFLKRRFRVKALLQHHGLDVLQKEVGRLPSFFKKIQNYFLVKKSKKIVQNHDLNIGVSQRVLDHLHDDIASDKVNSIVLYNGVDTKKFFPLSKAEKQEYVIGCVANFWELKDHITLIKAVEILIEKGLHIKVEFIGTGRTKNNCVQYIKDKNLGSHFNFFDEVIHSDLNEFYNNINLFALPSYHEALGCVYLEAWATNTPFIGVKEQGVEELVPDEYKNKLLIEKGDVLALANKIEYFYFNKQPFVFNADLEINKLIRSFLDQIEKLDR